MCTLVVGAIRSHKCRCSRQQDHGALLYFKFVLLNSIAKESHDPMGQEICTWLYNLRHLL